MVLAQPIIMVLFMRGEFDASEVTQVSYALFAYLSGLMSFMFIHVGTGLLFSSRHQNTGKNRDYCDGFKYGI